jgi:hypothetical protein
MAVFCLAASGYPLLSHFRGPYAMTNSVHLSVALAVSLVLVACGGGGTGTPIAVLPTTTMPIPEASYAADSAEMGGWTVLQQARVLCGFGELTQDTRLDAAALAHARYLVDKSVTGSTSELSHYERDSDNLPDVSNPLFTGENPWNRTSRQGYGDQVAEILEATVWKYVISNPPVFPTMEERGANSMLSLLNTVYHLTGAMYDGADVGFGADIQTAVTGSARREEYRFGSLNGYQNTARRIKLGSGKLATYPCQGSSNIPSTFVPANETPNPFPSMTSTSQTVGPPIYLKVDAGQVLTVTASSLSKNGVTLSTLVLDQAHDPHQEIGAHEAFVVPASALSPYSIYRVNLEGTLNGTPFTRSFTMSTGQ